MHQPCSSFPLGRWGLDCKPTSHFPGPAPPFCPGPPAPTRWFRPEMKSGSINSPPPPRSAQDMVKRVGPGGLRCKAKPRGGSFWSFAKVGEPRCGPTGQQLPWRLWKRSHSGSASISPPDQVPWPPARSCPFPAARAGAARAHPAPPAARPRAGDAGRQSGRCGGVGAGEGGPGPYQLPAEQR